MSLKAAKLIFCMGLAASLLGGRVSAQTKTDIDKVHQNTSNRTIIVIAQCNATKDDKDLEGHVGEKNTEPKEELPMVASLSGKDREAITIVVPPKWYYKIAVKPRVPAQGSCSATAWEIKP